MKKILFLTLEYPSKKGGIATYYGGMVEELIRQGYEVQVMHEQLLSAWVWPHWLPLVFRLRSLVRTHKPDVIFVGHVLPLGTVAWIFKKTTKIPYVVFTHGMDLSIAKKSLRKRWLVGMILRSARAVIANCEFTKNIATSYGVPAQTMSVVYPSPAPLKIGTPEVVERVARQFSLSGKKILLSVGRLVRRKGFDKVLEAMPLILKSEPHALYVLVGEGPDRARLADKVYKLGLQGTVRMVGAVDSETLGALYSISDILIMPSRDEGKGDVEGFGIVFLEAALFGKPSIGGRSGGVAEAIVDGQTGILVDPLDSSAIAKEVLSLLHDDATRVQLGNNAKDRTLKEFNWQKQLSNLIRILD